MREVCRDCGAAGGQRHALGCMSRAVDRGEMTPRERQVKILERQMALGIRRVPLDNDYLKFSFTHAFRGAVVAGSSHRTAVIDEVVHANPADIQRLVSEFSGASPGRLVAGTSESPLTFEGRKIVQDHTVPEGSLDIVPRKVDDIIRTAPPSMNVQTGVQVDGETDKPIVFGFDPAFDRKVAPFRIAEVTDMPGDVVWALPQKFGTLDTLVNSTFGVITGLT